MGHVVEEDDVVGEKLAALGGQRGKEQFVRLADARVRRCQERAKSFHTYNMARERFTCGNKYKAINSIRNAIRIEGERSEEDGIRIDEEDGWFLVRASGTEPIIRLTMEYKDKKKLEKRKDYLSALIKEKAGKPD